MFEKSCLKLLHLCIDSTTPGASSQDTRPESFEQRSFGLGEI